MTARARYGIDEFGALACSGGSADVLPLCDISHIFHWTGERSEVGTSGTRERTPTHVSGRPNCVPPMKVCNLFRVASGNGFGLYVFSHSKLCLTNWNSTTYSCIYAFNADKDRQVGYFHANVRAFVCAPAFIAESTAPPRYNNQIVMPTYRCSCRKRSVLPTWSQYTFATIEP